MNRWHISSVTDNYDNSIGVGDLLNITDVEGKVHEVVVENLTLKDGMLFVNQVLLDIEIDKEREN